MKIIINIKENSTDPKVKYSAYVNRERYIAFGKTKKTAFKKLVKILEEEFFKSDNELRN